MLRCPSLQGVPALAFDQSATFSGLPAFGRYRVLHQTGSGVLGPVFRACDSRSGALVAVKAFGLDMPPDQIVRLADRLRCLASSPIDHPAVTSPLDAGLEAASPYLVFPFEAGETLDVLLRRLGPLGLEEGLPLLRRIAAAVDAGWAAGVGHGALHPRDIFVPEEGASGLRVAGFGIVRAFEAAGLPVPVRRPYTPSERASASWDHRADVYSLGVIAHELLTGRRPAPAGDQDGGLDAGLLAECVGLRRALARALAETPGQRFDTAAALLSALDEALGRPAVRIESRVEPVLPTVPPRGANGPGDVASASPAGAATTRPVPAPTPPALLADATWNRAAATAADVAGTLAADWLAPTPGVDLILRAPDASMPGPSGVPLSAAPAPSGDVAGRRRADPSRRRAVMAPMLATAAALAGLALGAAGAVWLSRDDGDEVSRPAADSSMTAPSSSPPALALLSTPSSSADLPEGAEAPSPALARLLIRSEPPGAIVTIGGQLRGGTPLVVRGLPFGTHAIEVARPGHVPRRERVTLSPARPARALTVALEPGIPTVHATAAAGTIDVESRPRGARVTIDDRFVGHTPLRLPELTPGRHVLILDLDGYRRVTAAPTVTPGQIVRLRLDLTEIGAAR